MKNRTLALFLLLLLPSIFSFVGNNFPRAYCANDPDYIYLMNALSICRGKDVGHVDNPGTPVMELAALVISVHHFFDPTEKEPLGISVTRNPDKYVELTRQFFILLIALFMIIVGWTIFLYLKSIWPALVFQFTPFLSVNVLEHAWTKVSPEPLLLAISFIFTLLIFVFYFDEKKNRYWYVVAFTLLSGFGLATKATFLPLIIAPFFLLKGWKKNLLYSLGVIAAFFIFTTPAHNEYKNMFRWFRRLISHTGQYGKGEVGLIDSESYLSNIGQIVSHNPAFVIGLLILLSLTISILYVKKKTQEPGDFSWPQRISWAIIASGILGILVVAKHYHSNHYLMPVLGINGLIFILAVERAKELVKYKYLPTILYILFFVVSVPVFMAHSIPELQIKNRGYVETNKEYKEVERIIDSRYADYSQLIYFPNSLNKESALKFGNGYSKLNNQSILEKVYPEACFINMIGQNLELWTEPVLPEDVVNRYGYKLILKGRPLKEEGYRLVSKLGLSFKPIFEGHFQSVYILDTVKMPGPLKQYAVRYQDIIRCGAEKLSFDKNSFQSGSHFFSSAETRTTEKTRTGVYAVKLDTNHQYGLRYDLENCKPGQTIELSVWRFPTGPAGSLVVSASDPSALYMFTNNPVTTERSGWQKLSQELVIPNNMQNKRLSIYLWNNGETPVYFDDLTIRIK